MPSEGEAAAVGISVAICAAVGNIEQSRQRSRPPAGAPEGAAMRVHPIPAESEPPNRRQPALRRSAGAAHGGVDAEFDRRRRSRPGWRARTDRCGAPFRRGARHQVRDVRRTARARRDDRCAPAGCLAAGRPPPAPRARGGARGASSRAGPRAFDCRPGRQGRLGRETSGPDHRPDQHHRIDLAAGDRRALRRELAAGGAGAIGAGFARLRLREVGDPRAGTRRHSVAAMARRQGHRPATTTAK